MLPARGRVAGGVGRPPRAAGGRGAIARDRDAPRAAAVRGRRGRSVGRSPGLPQPEGSLEAGAGAPAGHGPPGPVRATANTPWRGRQASPTCPLPRELSRGFGGGTHARDVKSRSHGTVFAGAAPAGPLYGECHVGRIGLKPRVERGRGSPTRPRLPVIGGLSGGRCVRPRARPGCGRLRRGAGRRCRGGS